MLPIAQLSVRDTVHTYLCVHARVCSFSNQYTFIGCHSIEEPPGVECHDFHRMTSLLGSVEVSPLYCSCNLSCCGSITSRVSGCKLQLVGSSPVSPVRSFDKFRRVTVPRGCVMESGLTIDRYRDVEGCAEYTKTNDRHGLRPVW